MKKSKCNTVRKYVFAFLMFLTLSLNAQDNVMKFMGIPIDGPKSEMILKLQAKGFAPKQIEIDLENAQNEVIRHGGDIPEGKVRERDGAYFMNGYFDGKRCTIVLFSYKSNVYKVCVFLDDSYQNKIDAFYVFNYFAEKLQEKYFDDNNFYKLLDYSDQLEFDADYHNMFVDKQNNGGVLLHITYPKVNMEYHVFLEYINVLNMPDGEDL